LSLFPPHASLFPRVLDEPPKKLCPRACILSLLFRKTQPPVDRAGWPPNAGAVDDPADCFPPPVVSRNPEFTFLSWPFLLLVPSRPQVSRQIFKGLSPFFTCFFFPHVLMNYGPIAAAVLMTMPCLYPLPPGLFSKQERFGRFFVFLRIFWGGSLSGLLGISPHHFPDIDRCFGCQYFPPHAVTFRPMGLYLLGSAFSLSCGHRIPCLSQRPTTLYFTFFFLPRSLGLPPWIEFLLPTQGLGSC